MKEKNQFDSDTQFSGIGKSMKDSMRSIKAAKFLIISAVFFFSACGSPNDYDSHANGSDSIESADSHNDTIQGRSPDSASSVVDSANLGIGDTTLEKTH